MKLSACVLLMLLPTISFAVEWPTDDNSLDKLLKEKSLKYKRMAAAVEERQGYRIEASDDTALGDVTCDKNGLIIRLNPKLQGARRATVLIWEIGNAFQRPRFDEIDQRVKDGSIRSHTEFGLRMELIEYDTFRHHREVLEDLSASLGPVDSDFLFFINPSLKRLEEYALPYVHDYIEAQAKSRHTHHYEEWYYRQNREDSPSEKRGEPSTEGDGLKLAP